jgi:hypothetical protein
VHASVDQHPSSTSLVSALVSLRSLFLDFLTLPPSSSLSLSLFLSPSLSLASLSLSLSRSPTLPSSHSLNVSAFSHSVNVSAFFACFQEKRNSYGGTSRDAVLEQVRTIRARIADTQV